jgi:hypothetical protein
MPLAAGYDGAPKVMAVTVTVNGDTLRLGRPLPLLDMRVPAATGVVEQYAFSNNRGPRFDVFPDAKRFVMIRGADLQRTREIVLVQNFFEEVKRLAPPR